MHLRDTNYSELEDMVLKHLTDTRFDFDNDKMTPELFVMLYECHIEPIESDEE